jgi:hypothetical protein
MQNNAIFLTLKRFAQHLKANAKLKRETDVWMVSKGLTMTIIFPSPYLLRRNRNPNGRVYKNLTANPTNQAWSFNEFSGWECSSPSR